MRSIHRLALVLSASLAAGACLGEKRPPASAPAAAAASVTGPAAPTSASDPEVESLRKSSPGGWRDFYVLSPEDSQTDDPNLPVKLVRIAKLRHDRIGVVMEVENRREAAIAATDIGAALVDGDDRTMPVSVKPSDEIPPEKTRRLVWIFAAKDAAKGALELRFEIPGTKTWPVVFSKEKPPDFKATPAPGEQPGPQGPGPMGPQGY